MIKSKQLKKPQLVLIVDDQEINRDVLGMILEDDYEIIYASNGREALQMIEENRDRLSVVLLDLIMPEMDGFKVLDCVRNDELLKSIPIIVLTAERNAELRALEMGAADFITKPFDMHEVILARVGRIIELSEGRQLIQAAEHDPLTGLYTRNFFFEYANRIHQYHPHWHMDAVVLNIEQFHSVNALNGREFGDRVLAAIGDEIRAFLAETEGIASRFEADRFDIYCEQQGDYQALLDRIQDQGQRPVQHRQHPPAHGRRALAGGRGAGAAVRPGPGRLQHGPGQLQDPPDDLRRGDAPAGADEPAPDERPAPGRGGTGADGYYQPKYNVQCNPPRLSSAEALIRWNHPELGMVSPGSFIPLFESNGQISAVDNYVWNEAARQIAEWREKYGVTMPVSVNLSRVDVFDPTLEDRLEGLVSATAWTTAL